MLQNNLFEYDLYISFAKADNMARAEGGEPWVNCFNKFLISIIEQILGDSPRVLGYNNHEKPIKSELLKAGIFVTVLSPEYCKNTSCLEELIDFTDKTEKPQVYKVLKFPVSSAEQPHCLQHLLSYNLYDVDTISGDVREFTDFFSSNAERKFWLKLVDLAYDISSAIRKNRLIEVELKSQSNLIEKTVYLAEVGTDLQMHRDNIKRELIRHGFIVLPDRELPTSKSALEVSIKKDLEKCRLSIHLIGDHYGELIEGTEKSVLDFQNELSSEYNITKISNSNHEFNRLIWISPDAEFHNDKQKIFVDNIRRDADSAEDSEIIQSPIEGFKTMILDYVYAISENNSNKIKKDIIGKTVYMMYDQIDQYEAKQVIDFLKYQDFEVIPSKFDGNLLELRENHLENLKNCDFSFIYLNQVNDLWVQMKYLDLLKAPGLGRSKKEIKKAILIGKNAKTKIESLKKYNAPLFQYSEGAQTDLINFLNKK